MELFNSNIKKIQDTKTPKIGNRNPKKASYISGNVNPEKKYLYFRKQKPPKNPHTSRNGTILYLKKRNFSIFPERYIQNRDIFRTLVYSKPETYSEYLQTSTKECFAKIAIWCTFQPQPP